MSVTVKINNSVWVWLKAYLDRHAVVYQVVGEPTKIVLAASGKRGIESDKESKHGA